MSGREEQETNRSFSHEEAKDLAHSSASGLDGGGFDYIQQATASATSNRAPSELHSQASSRSDEATDAKTEEIESRKGEFVPLEKADPNVDLTQADSFI